MMNDNKALTDDQVFDDNEFNTLDDAESSTASVDASADIDGSVVNNDELKEPEENASIMNEADFINESGNIVVQSPNDVNENGFNLVYIDIEKIAIAKRIRKTESVDALVKSIQSTGLLEPLVVAPTATEGLYVLLDGYRRIQACARVGKTKIPCVINNHVNTPELPILEAMYNHSQRYNIKEQVEYIDYLEKEKGIMNPAMIEYLLQMNSGDYSKLKDILSDNDEDIVTKLYDGVYDIATAFKKLEQRRRKESAEEKENKKAEQVYGNEEKSGVDQVAGSGDEADGHSLTDEQIKQLTVNAEDLDSAVEDQSLDNMVEADKNIEGFQPHQQKTGEREYIDPIIKKSVMARDHETCQCCKRGGQQYVDVLDLHHTIPVFLGGKDDVDNSIMLCVACHRLVHLYSTGDLIIDSALMNGTYDTLSEADKLRYPNEEIFEDEKSRFKRIVLLGSKIRQGIAAQGMNREEYKKQHPNTGIGRELPGKDKQVKT